MDSQNKRLLLALALIMAITSGWFYLQTTLYPPPPSPKAGDSTTQTQVTDGLSPTTQAEQPSLTAAPDEAGQTPPVVSRSARMPGALFVRDAAEPSRIELGDDHQPLKSTGVVNPYKFKAVTTNRGAGVEAITLSGHRKNVAKSRKKPDHDPYPLVQPIENPLTAERHLSFQTASIKIDDQVVDLHDALWRVMEQTSDTNDPSKMTSVTFQATIRDDLEDILRIRKTYQVMPDSPHLAIDLELTNLSVKPRTVVLTEGGPVGIALEDVTGTFRRIVTAVTDGQSSPTKDKSPNRADVFKTPSHTDELRWPDDKHPVWCASGDKYFAVIVAPVPEASSSSQPFPAYLSKLTAKTLIALEDRHDDLTFEYVLMPPAAIPADGQQPWRARIEAYCGPKSETVFDSLPAEQQNRNYAIVRSPDISGCTFESIGVAMRWLLNAVHRVIPNYGVAIIVLVIIVRLILHPISKRSQANMMKMQKNMGRLKPKMEALQKQHKNDKQKLNEEMMKLYREEGVNPAGNMLGCLPMFLQMPIWVALYGTLNTSVELLHEPFFAWIRDLSAPDALLSFAQPGFTLPLIGAITGPIHSLNILPFVMAATMYFQQKITQKLSKPAEPPKPNVDENGNPVVDQMAQQQKIMGFMTIFMSIMFYNLPSGLNLYILSSSILGMLEQLQIKKQLQDKDDRGDFGGDSGGVKKLPGNSKPGFFERLQQRAEEVRLAQAGRPPKEKQKRKKQPRF